MDYMTDESSGGASQWERQVYAHLRRHVETERGLLEKYSQVAEQTESKAFRYLVNLLIEDEVRHHRLFAQLMQSLETEAELKAEEPIIPYMDFHRADHRAVLDGAKELLESEESDVRELKRLQRELRDVRDTSLWGLLVELMERDAEKHVTILRFVRDHA
jgi:rubrerythrin